jgi:SPX domain protein involved in polyphosphate accumulation
MNNVFKGARNEIKYFVAPTVVQQVKDSISPFVSTDPHMNGYKNYTVRSIYFDTPELDYHYEKMDGLKVRKKLRLRTYNNFENDKIAFLEIKRRYNQIIVKERAKVSLEKAQNFLECPKSNGIFDTKDTLKKRVLEKFAYNLANENLKSTLLVVYEREAYQGIHDPTTRITFDSNLRYKVDPEISEIFNEHDLETILGDYVIIEFKFNDFMPKWMRKIMRTFCLSAQSISKYCTGIHTLVHRSSKTLLFPGLIFENGAINGDNRAD